MRRPGPFINLTSGDLDFIIAHVPKVSCFRRF
jgi:hypothetical protein